MENKNLIEFIKNWMSNYALKAKAKGFVVGVSGGIDSALTSTLAAMTGLKVICIEMPIYQDTKQANRAKEHINWLKKKYSNVESQEINLSSLFDQFKSSMGNTNINDNNYEISLVNSRARLRMSTLYFIAQLNELLVAGTGNKVEDFGIGFFTKYGDGGVDISPIADLLKSQVYQLCETLKVSESILQAPPTDGLWGDERTDEDQIGASYTELEWAMNYQNENKPLNDRQKEVLEIYTNFNKKNKHKMIPVPICKIPK
jgi:NAD+ synthase